MDARDLRAFLAVAETLHFGRAAERLSITPPPLTRQIQRIEREIGSVLFDRSKRAVRLTAAGAMLVDEARDMLFRMDGLRNRLARAAGGETGVLRAGVISAALLSQAPRLQEAMRRSLPDVRVAWHVMSSAEQILAIRQDRIDLGFVHTPIEHDGLALQPLVREPLVAVLPVRHPLARRRSIRLRALKDESFVVATRDRIPSYYDRFIAACHAEGFEPKLDHQPQTMVSFVLLVAMGAGVTIAPAAMRKVRLDGVAYVRLSGNVPYAELSVAWNARNVSPVLARALDFARTAG